MKIISKVLAFCLFQATTAFVVKTTPTSIKASPLMLQSVQPTQSSDPALVQPGMEEIKPVEEFDMFPPGTFPPYETIEGGKTVRTYPMPDYAERVQMTFTTNGRPLKCEVNLWLGPERKTHTMKIDMQDGSITPFFATLKFKKVSQVLRVETSETLELPVLAAVSVPSPERSEELGDNTEKVWKDCPPEQKLLIQGGCTTGGGGAVRSWTIPETTESVQVLAWAKDTGKKSFKVKMEVLQAPNNKKQDFFLQCGGGSQPYHCVLQTPGPGWKVRITNQKFVEDGLVQFAVVGDGVVGSNEAEPSSPYMSSSMNSPGPSGPKREWWM